jgi:bla regulator protein BlaR1
MHTPIMTLLFDERIIRALSLTLVHSLWQGLLLAIVTGLLILLTRRSGPAVRYGLFSAALVLFCLGSVTTFILQWDRGVTAVAAVTPSALIREGSKSPIEGAAETTLSPMMIQQGHRSIMDSLAAWFNEHAVWIVAIWFVILSVKILHVTVQLGAQHRLGRYRVHDPAAPWKERVRELSLRLGIRVPVLLLESEIVTVPMMMGFLKPIILVPVSLLSQLPPAEVEAILLHELAHIRRGDYFVNIIFTFWEMLFFFNPAVLWICSLIREERENCCDDIAVRQTGSKKEFISALVSFIQIDRGAGGLAMSFPGTGNHLLQRVRRIAYRDDKRLDGKERFFLVFCFIVAGLLTLAYTHASPQHKNHPHAMTALLTKDSVPDEQVDSIRVAAKKEKMEEKVRIKAEKTSRKEEKKEEIKEKKDVKEKDEAKEKAEANEMKEKDELKEPKEKEELKEVKEKEEMKEMKEKDELKEMKEPKEKDELKERDELQEIKALLDKELMKERQEIRELKERTETPEIKEQLEMLDAREVAEKKEVIRQLELSKMKIDREVHEQKVQFDSLTRIHNDHHQKTDQSQRMLQSTIDGLVQERLIDDRNGAFSFSLDNEALIVNGVRQPEELHKRFVQEYLGGPHNRVEFSRDKDKGIHSSVTINTN